MSKKHLIGILIGLTLSICFGFYVAPKNPSELATVQSTWLSVGTLTSQQATFGVTERDAATVEALATGKIAFYDGIPFWSNDMEFRFQLPADGNTATVEMWVTRGDDDYYTLASILALTGGTQAAGSNVFADTITVTESFLLPGKLIDADGSNGMGRYSVNLGGYSKIIFIATTWTATVTLEAAPQSNALAGRDTVSINTSSGSDPVPVLLSNPVKTSTIDIGDDWQVVTAGTGAKGTPKDIPIETSVQVILETAIVEASAHARGPLSQIEISYKDGDWTLLTQVRGLAATGVTTTTVGAVTDANSIIDLTDPNTGGFDDVGRKWYIQDSNEVLSESVKTLSLGPLLAVSLFSNIQRSHASGVSVWNNVDEYPPIVIPKGVAKVRVNGINDDDDTNYAYTWRILTEKNQ